MILKKFVGDRAFYKRILAIAIPIIVQNGLTQFVNLLDNVMVGSLGTEAMSGVSIVNQFVFIFNLLIFGAMSAGGIFTAQYHGSGDVSGVRNTFRFKLIAAVLLGAFGTAAFLAFDEALISSFLHAGEGGGDLLLTLKHGKDYLTVFVIGMIPYALSQAYASTLRETGETVLPMYSSIVAIVCNCLLNALFIFGLSMGVRGAAIATVISRFVELAFIVILTHTRHSRYRFVRGAYRSFKLPRTLVFNIAVRGLPIILNECLWSVAMTMRNQAYSLRGLDVVAAINISTVIINLASVVYLSCGAAIAIIVGAELGSGNIEKARDSAWKMLAFSVFCAIVMGAVMLVAAPFFPLIYETSDTVRSLAAYMTVVSGLLLPFYAISHASYFAIRSGGNVLVTFLMDCGFMWTIVVPLSLAIGHFTNLDIHIFFLICQATEILKLLAGLFILCRGRWAKQLVGDKKI